MLKKLGFKTMALAAGLAVAAPTISLARDRDDFRGRNVDRHERFERRDRDDRRFNLRFYSAPTRRSDGYYDRYGVWHPYGFYDRYGVWHAYGY
jgi:hypothetical protein